MTNQIPDCESATLREARLQCHYAVEWITRASRFLATPTPSYDYIALQYDANKQRLCTVNFGTPTIFLSLSIKNLVIYLTKEGLEVESVALEEMSHEDVGIWIRENLIAYGLEGNKIYSTLPYNLDQHELSRGAVYRYSEFKEGFENLAIWYDTIDSCLRNFIEKFKNIYVGDATPLCWPHHFDHASLMQLDNKGEKSIGIGFSPGDETYPEPYLYLNPWPYPNLSDLPTPTNGSEWHTEGFFSLILKADVITESNNQSALLYDFYNWGIQTSLKLIP